MRGRLGRMVVDGSAGAPGAFRFLCGFLGVFLRHAKEESGFWVSRFLGFSVSQFPG